MVYTAATPADATTIESLLSPWIAVVNGGSAGIGLESTRALASAGARVIVPARDVEKARPAVGTLATVAPMELTDPPSIAAFADRFLKTGQPLDLLVRRPTRSLRSGRSCAA